MLPADRDDAAYPSAAERCPLLLLEVLLLLELASSLQATDLVESNDNNPSILAAYGADGLHP